MVLNYYIIPTFKLLNEFSINLCKYSLSTNNKKKLYRRILNIYILVGS